MLGKMDDAACEELGHCTCAFAHFVYEKDLRTFCNDNPIDTNSFTVSDDNPFILILLNMISSKPFLMLKNVFIISL